MACLSCGRRSFGISVEALADEAVGIRRLARIGERAGLSQRAAPEVTGRAMLELLRIRTASIAITSSSIGR